MLEKGGKLPNLEEAKEETRKRLKIIDRIMPYLRSISEEIILVGSMAYGQNYSVRKESDIDIIILIDREKVDEILKLDIFNSDQLKKDAIEAFKSRVSDLFTLIEEIDGIGAQFHFWDKNVHYKLQGLEYLRPKYFDPIIKSENDFTYGYNFEGRKVRLKIPITEKYKSGFLQSFSAYEIHDDEFIPRVVINNLLSNPLILYSKNKRTAENLEILWEKIMERLKYESGGKFDLNKKNVLNSLYGNWNFSPEANELIRNRMKNSL